MVVLGGDWGNKVQQIDLKTRKWETLPIMNDRRYIRNKICFIDGYAYVAGG